MCVQHTQEDSPGHHSPGLFFTLDGMERKQKKEFLFQR